MNLLSQGSLIAPLQKFNAAASRTKADPHVVFQKMLKSGHLPDAWGALLAARRQQCPG